MDPTQRRSGSFVSSTPARARRYRWTILSTGVVAQAANSAILLGLPAIAPALRQHYGLTLTQVGVVLAALNFGSVGTLLLWGIVADGIGERAVIALGQTGAAAGMVWAGHASSFGSLVAALSVTGGVGAGVNAASGRAVMAWFGEEERGFALGIRQMAVPLGGAVAAIALPLLNEHISLRAAFYGLASGCVVAAMVGAILLRTERTDEHSLLWRICFASVFYVTTQLSLLGFFVLFLHDHRGVSTGVAAGGLAALQVLGGVARVVVGRLSDRLGLRIVLLRWIALCLAVALGVAVLLLQTSTWIVTPALVLAGTLALSWNGLSFTAAAEAAGRARAGAAIGLQQTFLSAGSIVAPIGFAAVVHQGSWRLAFACAALSPLAGYALLSPLAERRP